MAKETSSPQQLPPGFHNFGGMKLGMVPTSSLTRRRTNYRAMPEASMAALRNSVEKFGFKSFIVVAPGKQDGTFEVVDGHHRWETAQSLNMPEVPVVMLEQDSNGTDLAMLSFNVQADVIPDVYVDFLKEMTDKIGTDTLASFTGITDDFLADLTKTLQQVNIGEINLGTGQADDTADRSRGNALNVSLPSTSEVTKLLAYFKDVFKTPTDSDTILTALKHLYGLWNKDEKK